MRTEVDLHVAVASASNFFTESREPHALLWLAVIHRKFRIDAFADALQRYDRVLSEQPDQAPLRRVLRRFAARDNPLQPDDWDAVTNPSDRILVTALYCDRVGLPPGFAESLRQAAGAGGYYLPHVILTCYWIAQNGVRLTLPEGFMDNVYRASAAIIDSDLTIVSDLRLEAAAFLHLAGQGALVNDAFVDRVIALQNDDGGWGRDEKRGGSDWHSTILGLLLLLHVKFPANSDDARLQR